MKNNLKLFFTYYIYKYFKGIYYNNKNYYIIYIYNNIKIKLLNIFIKFFTNDFMNKL